MFFNRKGSLFNDYSFLRVDMHNHILPGIDDGAPDIQTSIQLLKELKNLGFSEIIPTPHTYASLYPNTPNTIGDAFDFLQIALSTNVNNDDLPIVKRFASEYMIDHQFSEIVTTNPPLSFGQNKVLIEMSFADSAPMLFEEIFHLQLRGFTPILAHPERYPYLFGQLSYFKHLVSIGCELQLNLLSLSDHYGKGPQSTAKLLLENQLYSWAGTDTHHMGHIELLRSLIENKIFKKIQKYPFKNTELDTYI